MIYLKPLPYSYDALEPVISARTISFHYEKHHNGYVNKLITLLSESNSITANLTANNLSQLINDVKAQLSNNNLTANERSILISIYNNAAQHYNHEFYWESLTPTPTIATSHSLHSQSSINSNIPSNIMNLINSQTSLDSLLDQLHKAGIGLFGSGWTWITLNTDTNTLTVETTTNADLPKHSPLLVLDVWEHAYYLDYQNDRSKHLRNLLQYLNWEKASERLSLIQNNI